MFLLDDLVLGPVVEHLNRLAAANENPKRQQAEQIIVSLRASLNEPTIIQPAADS